MECEDKNNRMKSESRCRKMKVLRPERERVKNL